MRSSLIGWLSALGLTVSFNPCHGERSSGNYAIVQETLNSRAGWSAAELYSSSANLGEPIGGESAAALYHVTHGYEVGAAANLGADGSEELIVNGSFEITDGKFVADQYGLMSLLTGSTTIRGWTTTIAELAWSNNNNTFGASTPFGAYWLDLTGYHDRAPYAGVTQTIATRPGESYRLSLAVGSNASFPDAGGEKVVSVSAGGSEMTFAMKGTNLSGDYWGHFSFQFTAHSIDTVITISGITASGVYLGLDDVSVRAEPSVVEVASAEQVGNRLRLTILKSSGKVIKLQACSDLLAAAWKEVADGDRSQDGENEIISVPIESVQPRQFFRLQVPP